jgi:hypothetical protein
MTHDQRSRTRAGWLTLLAVPVLCCIGHAVLLAAGVGSLTAVTGAATGSTVLGPPWAWPWSRPPSPLCCCDAGGSSDSRPRR